MRLGYHGTSLESAQGILKEGYRSETTMFWSVSTGNMHVFDSAYNNAIELATNQSISAALIATSLKRALVVVDISKKNLKEDKFCSNAPGAYEIVDKVNPDDIMAVYVDVDPLNPILRVIHKVAQKKMHKRVLFNDEALKLTREEEAIYNLLHEVKTDPNYRKFMKVVYKREECILEKDLLVTTI
jgi:hypothetical protein